MLSIWPGARARRWRVESGGDSISCRATMWRCCVPPRPPPWRRVVPALPCGRRTALRAHPCVPSANPLPNLRVTARTDASGIHQPVSSADSSRTFIREKRTVPLVALWLDPPPMRERHSRVISYSRGPRLSRTNLGKSNGISGLFDLRPHRNARRTMVGGRRARQDCAASRGRPQRGACAGGCGRADSRTRKRRSI
jgi:hypothetical protein